MSAYVNDQRVKRNGTSDETYDVQGDVGGWWIVLPEDDGTWSAMQYGGARADVKGFVTADEAIRSLIGEPR